MYGHAGNITVLSRPDLLSLYYLSKFHINSHMFTP